MEESLINHHHDLIQIQLKPHHNHHTLLFANGVISHGHDHDHEEDIDIEMFAFDESKSYTSLKDIMSESPPAAACSPTNGSWKEIPIKDPLVQHAAVLYLQPMAALEPRPADAWTWWRKCCGLLGCFNDVVLVMFKGWFSSSDQGQPGSDDGDDFDRDDHRVD